MASPREVDNVTAMISPELLADYQETVCKPRNHQHPTTPRGMLECCYETMAQIATES